MRELLQENPKPFVLQIGANDGIRADPVYSFITGLGLPALLVEPHPNVFGKLKFNYATFPNATLVNLAIAKTPGAITLYAPHEDSLQLNPKLSGLCSLNSEQLRKSLQMMQVPSAVQEIEVPSETVEGLLRKYQIESIDVLQIDAEGYDWQILQQFDLKRMGINLINFEFFNLNDNEKSEVIRFLASHDYEMTQVLGDVVARRKQSGNS